VEPQKTLPDPKSIELLKSLPAETGCALHEDAAWCASRVRATLPPTLVAAPADRQQLTAVIRHAAQQQASLAPTGAGSKRLCGGISRHASLAVSTERLNRVIDYPASDLTITVESGITIKALRETLTQQGQMLPLDVPYAEKATLGGTLAANLNGPQRLGYGAWRDLVIGLEFATSEGKLARAGGRVVKNVAGYDLPKLLIGSFGTLGVITEVSLKVFPIPSRSATFVIGYHTAEEAGAAAETIRGSQFFPMALQWMDAASARLSGTTASLPAAYNLVVAVAGPSVVIERAQRDLPTLLGSSSATIAHQVDGDTEPMLWRAIAELTPTFLAQHEGVVVKASLPLTQLAPFAEQIEELCGKPGIGHAINAQAGVGVAHLHLWSEFSGERTAVLARAAEQAIVICEQLGGRATAEWFSAGYDAKMNPWGTLGGDFALMRQIKQALDPQGMLNPGRFYGGI
jgi:glycolate oxidase FAD binding subunit